VNKSGSLDFSKLLRQATKCKSHGIDKSLLVPVRWSRSHQGFRPTRGTPDLELEDESTVKFTGTVGVGDRCARADEPLPRPEPKKRSRVQRALRKLTPKRLLRNNSDWKPFVAPFCGAKNEMHLTPRLVSYYEVKILPDADDKTNSEDQGCVAVGLATAFFDVQNSMPGWNEHSFGYHGDDGGIYHASGRMLTQFGEIFGAGDTIGCGIDYRTNRVFFTRNGEFLGRAFTLPKAIAKKDLYPVVGMDTKCPVQCNFGSDSRQPFQFDLYSLIFASAPKNSL
jgi:SPRY domain